MFTWYSIAAAFIAMLILGIALGGGAARLLFENRVVVFLGTISYSIYLWHFPIATWVAWNVDVARIGLGAYAAITIAATVAVSAASYYVAERPFLKRQI
jgi:peptidoglycan/LPS O-acetylase OafA/YrhL